MARKLGFKPLIKAIVTRLRADVLTSTYAVHNNVPKNTSFPYVRVGDPTGTRKGARDHYGEDATVTIHVWSEYPGDSQASEMMSNIVQVLTEQKISLTDGYSELYCLLEYAEIFRDPDEPERDIHHGVMRFRYWLETAS